MGGRARAQRKPRTGEQCEDACEGASECPRGRGTEPRQEGGDRGQDIEGVLRGSGKAVSGKNRMYLNTGSELQRK